MMNKPKKPSATTKVPPVFLSKATRNESRSLTRSASAGDNNKLSASQKGQQQQQQQQQQQHDRPISPRSAVFSAGLSPPHPNADKKLFEELAKVKEDKEKLTRTVAALKAQLQERELENKVLTQDIEQLMTGIIPEQDMLKTAAFTEQVNFFKAASHMPLGVPLSASSNNSSSHSIPGNAEMMAFLQNWNAELLARISDQCFEIAELMATQQTCSESGHGRHRSHVRLESTHASAAKGLSDEVKYLTAKLTQLIESSTTKAPPAGSAASPPSAAVAPPGSGASRLNGVSHPLPKKHARTRSNSGSGSGLLPPAFIPASSPDDAPTKAGADAVGSSNSAASSFCIPHDLKTLLSAIPTPEYLLADQQEGITDNDVEYLDKDFVVTHTTFLQQLFDVTVKHKLADATTIVVAERQSTGKVSLAASRRSVSAERPLKRTNDAYQRTRSLGSKEANAVPVAQDRNREERRERRVRLGKTVK
ncbi:hypothetical protein DIPPA_12581 [Diplonema papillatum]|nr:hypothetical protein DIPPA_12581 [Diplonema papillatum]